MSSENKNESRFVKGRTDIKIVVLGSSGTGKTSFCNLWVNNVFPEEYKATVMSEFSFKMYNYKGNYYKIQLWDLAGQDKNIYTSKVFTKGAHGCLILYDTQSKNSFENTVKWKKSIDDNTRFIDETPLPIVLVQNKIDLVEQEELEKDEDELKKFVDDNGFLTFTRTSCKNKQNINETMDYLLANIIDRLEEYHKKANIPIDDNKRTSIVNQNVSLSTESLLNNKKSFCCV
jgi:small GTP-binding protein